MAMILTEKRVIYYSNEFKNKVVGLTERLNVKITKIAEILELHPMMIYRWRQKKKTSELERLNKEKAHLN